MILWLTGQTGAGKSTLAKRLAGKNTYILDGDELRAATGNWDFSEAGRRRAVNHAAMLAKQREDSGAAVIVAVIAPYEDQRREIAETIGAKFIYVPGGHSIDEDHPYEVPVDPVTMAFPGIEVGGNLFDLCPGVRDEDGTCMACGRLPEMLCPVVYREGRW